ncbi:MAG TPA: PAS domain S-box protein [Candidatus Wunengus sp. YC60]|uniref:PAS domain S-box protein n=1 Tax=Candidatus Wunengus sp. YC60 TaxID=3367697 RepID=UPI004029E5C7
MISIRTRLIVLICLLITIIDILSCLFFFIHTKNAQETVFKKLGTSLVILLTQDNEVKLALDHAQPAFLGTPIKRVQAFDRDKEIGYWRIANTQAVMVEEKAAWCGIQLNEIPARDDSESSNTPHINRIISSSGEVFYDFSVPVFEKQAFSEEAFATQILAEDKILAETKHRVLGSVQIGLSTRKLNEKIHEVILYGIIPLGLGIIMGGVVITFFLTRHIVSPIKQLASITLDIAGGNLSRTVDIRSGDEIGQLSMNFNQMTRSLEKSYADLRQEIVGHKHTEELLQYRLKIEELIATISSNFINLAPYEVDAGISRALKIIGEFAVVDRSYVFQYADAERKKMDNTHEWCAEGIESQINKLKGLSVDRFPWGMERLERFESIHVPRVVDMPDIAKTEKELQESQSVQSFVIVPMVYGGSLVGLLGFDSVRTENKWTEEDMALLKMVGEIFVNALEHKRAWEMLQKAHDKLEIRVMDRTLELLKANELLKEEISEHKKAKAELRKYEILISEITDLPYICDTEGNILFVNHMFDKLTGCKREEFIGKSFASLFDEENLKIATNAYAKTLKGESPLYELYFKDTGVLCEYKNLPLRDEAGNIIGVIGTARDITERKRMEEMLRKTNQTLRAMILASPLAITVFDSYGNVKMWNPSAEHIFGWAEEEVLGQFLPIIPKSEQDEFRALLDRVLRGESFMGREILGKKRDSSSIDISISTAPLCDTKGEVVGVVGIIADITEHKRMTDALRQAKEYAENLIETANVIVMGLDMNGNIRVFNKTAENITGYKKAEILGKNWFDVITPKDIFPYVWQTFHRWQNGEQLQTTYENPIIIKSGKRRYISWQNTEVRDQGRIVGIISFGNDITEQKRKKALVERLRLMSFVKDIGIAINEGNTTHEILQQCTEAIVHNLDAAFARIWTLNEKENVLELQASAGMYTHIDGSHSRIPVGKFKIGIIAQERIPRLTNNLVSDPDVSDKDWAQREGIIAFAGYPLIIKEHLVGVVAMFSRKPLTEFIQRALASSADIIALGIDRKCAEEALRVSENRYRRLLENLPQRIFHKDINSMYVSCNENYAKDLKIKPEEIFGKTDYDFYPKILANKYRSDDKRVMESGKTEDFEEKYIQDGREFMVQTIKTPLKDENGNIIGILGIFWDITEKIAMQVEAVRSRHLVSLGEMAAGVAHEINNPITGIINYSQIIANKSIKGSRENDLAKRIIREGERIAVIVRSLLSFARADDRKDKKSAVYVHEILSDTLTLTEAQMRKDGIILKLNAPPELPKIIANPHQIQQVFLNIVSNARYALNQKYQEAHDDKILEILGEKIVIDTCLYVRVIFYDRGIGIPADIINRIMNPFFTTKPVGKGTGLGLSISHGIISDHGGKLIIDSTEGKFTKVAVILPAMSQS